MSVIFLTMRRVNVRSDSGQALLLGLILIGVGVLAWACSYYIGHLVHDKISLIRATDAAVLSAATVQARTLNLHAYLNRAQLANQLAMLHLVTLASQERFRATQAQQSLKMNPPAFLIGMFFGPSYAGSYLAARAGGVSDSLAIQNLESAFHKHDQIIKETIEHSRKNILDDMLSARNQTLEKILILNVGESGSSIRGASLSDLGLTLEIVRDDLKQGVQYFSSQSPVWHSTFIKLTEPYGYLKPRHATRQNFWAVNVRCPHKRHELRRRGQTTANINGSFESNDTLSFHAIRSNRLIGCYQREYPMGWAQIDSTVKKPTILGLDLKLNPEHSSAPKQQNFSSQPFWKWVKQQALPGWNIFSGNENQLANLWASTRKIRWNSHANAGYAEVNSHSSYRFDINTTQSFKFLSLHKNKNRFTERFNFIDADSGDLMRAQSAAITYFSRPEKRSDGAEEVQNLFHPYWHAILVQR